MNALEDTRELVTTTSAPDTLNAIRTNRSRFVAGFVDDLLYKYPDVELASIHITETDGVITVTGRRGTLIPPAGHHLVHSEAFIDQDDPRSQPPPHPEICRRCIHTAHEDMGECRVCYCRSSKP